jgi:hypothetical protein
MYVCMYTFIVAGCNKCNFMHVCMYVFKEITLKYFVRTHNIQTTLAILLSSSIVADGETLNLSKNELNVQID